MRKRLLFYYYQIRYFLQVVRLIPQIFVRHVVFGNDYYWKRYFWDRLGILPEEIQSLVKGNECIWLQATSEGDVISLQNFLESIKKIVPSHKIIFSTNNHGSFRMLQKMKEIDGVIYFPWDLGFFCRRSLNIIKPECFIVVHHGFCLSFIKAAKKKGIRTVLISGFIRPGEMKEYDHFYYKRAFMGNFMKYFDYLGVQTEKDLKNFIALGADEEKVSLIGSLKMDLSYAELDQQSKESIFKSLKMDTSIPIFLAATTHRDEEEEILKAYKEVLREVPDMKLIIVPRYIERSSEIRKIAEGEGFKTEVVVDLDEAYRSHDVFIIKIFGVLPKLYGIATMVFIGGSLIPRGAQNILEPMYHGKPIFFGPYIDPRKEFCDRLKAVWQGLRFQDSHQLAKGIIYLLNNPEKMKRLSREAKQVIAEYGQALNKNIDFIRNILTMR
ncbi:MAG: 3-deoxy-D-manno-octulosonic-acid transferase [Desulfobacteraceae bacterium Eth-SRB1]|nr:MAG: 3-deoxy-D-manno-octulosonic-acid transferase [Desulfobacteraceae bacterium Eth-SRB1]